jgi:pimeloyl-ACP methyl ester carboxylesterase
MAMKIHRQTPVVYKDRIVWDTVIDGVHRQFFISVFHNISKIPDSVHIPIINLNGIGEGAFSASVAVREFGPNVVSAILPLQEPDLKLTPENVEIIARELPALVAHYALQKTKGFRTVCMIARSQSGAVAIHGAFTHPELFSKLALLMPFGLNRKDLGRDTKQRRYAILKRLLKASFAAPFLDMGHLRTTREVMGYMSKSFLKRRLFSDLDTALSFDMNDELQSTASRMPVCVFLGETDPVFPASEVKLAIASSKIEIHEIKGSHATPGSVSGRKQLREVHEWIRSEAS